MMSLALKLSTSTSAAASVQPTTSWTSTSTTTTTAAMLTTLTTLKKERRCTKQLWLSLKTDTRVELEEEVEPNFPLSLFPPLSLPPPLSLSLPPSLSVSSTRQCFSLSLSFTHSVWRRLVHFGRKIISLSLSLSHSLTLSPYPRCHPLTRPFTPRCKSLTLLIQQPLLQVSFWVKQTHSLFLFLSLSLSLSLSPVTKSFILPRLGSICLSYNLSLSLANPPAHCKHNTRTHTRTLFISDTLS